MTEKTFTDKGENIKEKLIEITARILREKGFKSATVRAITKEAKVNIAAIRYYFGSKEELISAALEYMMSSLENISAYLDDSRLTAKERLKKYILAYFNLAHKHPALFRSISRPSSAEAQGTYFIYLNLLHDQCWQKITENVIEITGFTDPHDVELKVMQIFAAVEFPIILESNNKGSFITQYTDSDTLERYVDILLNNNITINHEKNEYIQEIIHNTKRQ